MAYKEFKEHLSKNELLQAQSCLKKHSKSNDTFAYQLGKLLLDNYDDKENIDNGIKILSEIAEKKTVAVMIKQTTDWVNIMKI